jgi:hypothetical protein
MDKQLAPLPAGLVPTPELRRRFLGRPPREAECASPRRHRPVYLWAHSASYLAAFVGGLIVMVNVWRSRRLLGEQANRRDP